jgi:hypothetical protein
MDFLPSHYWRGHAHAESRPDFTFIYNAPANYMVLADAPLCLSRQRMTPGNDDKFGHRFDGQPKKAKLPVELQFFAMAAGWHEQEAQASDAWTVCCRWMKRQDSSIRLRPAP